MKKRFLHLLCACVLLLPLAACQTAAPAPDTLGDLLSALTEEDIQYIPQYAGEAVTAETLVPLLGEAAAHPIEHEPLTRNGSDTDVVWSLDFYLASTSPGNYSGDDAVYLQAGLEENVVEVFAGANLPEGRLWLEDEALYQLVRTINDTPDGPVDEDAYAAYRAAVDARLDAPLASGTFSDWALVRFVQVDAAPALDALVYQVDAAYTADPPEQAPHLLAGGAYVDSGLRVLGLSWQNLLVVVDGVPAGFASYQWLYSGGLEQCETAQDLIDAVQTGNL